MAYLRETCPDSFPFAEEAGLLIQDDAGQLRTHWNLCGRIVFPYIADGEVIDLRTRTYDARKGLPLARPLRATRGDDTVRVGECCTGHEDGDRRGGRVRGVGGAPGLPRRTARLPHARPAWPHGVPRRLGRGAAGNGRRGDRAVLRHPASPGEGWCAHARARGTMVAAARRDMCRRRAARSHCPAAAHARCRQSRDRYLYSERRRGGISAADRRCAAARHLPPRAEPNAARTPPAARPRQLPHAKTAPASSHRGRVTRQ